MSAFEIYFIMSIGTIKAMLICASIFSIFFIIIFTIISLEHDKFGITTQDIIKVKSGTKKSLITCIFLLLFTIIPSSKVLIAMYTIPPIVNDTRVRVIPSKLLDIVNTRLDEILKHSESLDE